MEINQAINKILLRGEPAGLHVNLARIVNIFDASLPVPSPCMMSLDFFLGKFFVSQRTKW